MEFTVVTEHAAFKWLHTLKDPVSRLARWAMELIAHKVTIEHRAGTVNEAPDALSRLPFYEKEENVNISLISSNKNKFSYWYDKKLQQVIKHPDAYPYWCVKEENLYFLRPDKYEKTLSEENQWKKVLKDTEIIDCFKKYHEDPQAGHLGLHKTYDRMKRKVYWPFWGYTRINCRM